MAEEQLVVAFHDNTIYSFERAYRHSASSFGGPMHIEFSGIARGLRPVHLIARLAGLHIPALSNLYRLPPGMPLVYGMRYAGCEMAYRIVDPNKIEMLTLTPAEPSDDCPYADFPPLLPYVPLRLIDVPRRVRYRDFLEIFPNLPAEQPAELVVAVPSPASVGLSFWGNNDHFGVTIVFECDLVKSIVHAYTI